MLLIVLVISSFLSVTASGGDEVPLMEPPLVYKRVKNGT